MNNNAVILKILLFVVAFIAILGTMIYIDYQTYKKQEGLDKLGRKVSKTMNQVTKHTKQIAKSATNIKNILSILKCPVSIFSNIQKCAKYYFQDKVFEFIWIVLWIINFFIIYIPVFILDKIVCFTMGKCWNLSPVDVCISKKFFFKLVENTYFLISGGGRFLHRNSSDVQKCYCVPPIVFLFDPLRKFTSYFDKVVKGGASSNYTALVLPIGILGILMYQKR